MIISKAQISLDLLGRHLMEEDCPKTRTDIHGHWCCRRASQTTSQADCFPRRFAILVLVSKLNVYAFDEDMDDAELAEAVTLHIPRVTMTI